MRHNHFVTKTGGRAFNLITLLAAVALLAGLAACTLGPDYFRPRAVATIPASYKELDGWKLAQPAAGGWPPVCC